MLINMENIRIKINSFLKVLMMILVPLIIADSFFYLIGAFIAQDWNYENWWMFTSTVGRILLSLIQIMILVNIPKWYEEFKQK